MDSATETRDLGKMDLCLVRLDETGYYDSGFLKKIGVKRVWGVYLYDRGEQTHCCEVTPSYWLVQVDIAVEFSFSRTDPAYEKKSEKAEMEIRQVQENDGMYFHCHQIDILPDEDRHVHGSPFNGAPPDISYEDAFEGVVEHYRGNPRW
jgi:hypothetical protein